MLKKTIMFAAVAGLVLALAPAAQAVVEVYSEHFVGSVNNPSYGTGSPNTAQEIVWPAPLITDWVPGLNIGNSAIGWSPNGAGTYSTCISDQYNWWDPYGAGGTPFGVVPVPDGDQWHFFGWHDGGDADIYTNAGEVNIPDAARVNTQFSIDYATQSNNGLRWMAKVGGNWYSTDEFGLVNNGTIHATGVPGHGAVTAWAPTEILDVENATWYLWTVDPTTNFPDDAANLATGNPLSLPPGIIDGLGIFRDGSGKVGLDNLIVTGIPEPTTMALLAFGGLGVLLRRKRR